MEDFLLRWGICCAGMISNEFALALNMLPKSQHQIIAVASRDEKRSKEFASVHSVSRAYGSYKQLASDSEIDVVYIGAVNSHHLPLCKMMLEAGKHVLCEKTLGINAKEAKEMCEIAKTNKKFLMEAIWSRCFPSYAKLREIISSGVIGDITHVQAQLGIDFQPLASNFTSKEVGGGALLAIGCYPTQLAQLVYGENPIQQNSFGNLLKETGVDTDCFIFLRYSGDRTALLSISLLKNFQNEGIVYGTKGSIKVCDPIYAPTKLEVTCSNSKPTTYDFTLPPTPESRGFYIFNGEGFTYEAEEVRKCIMQGKLQSSLLTSEMSIGIAEVLDTARQQLSYHLPQDK